MGSLNWIVISGWLFRLTQQKETLGPVMSQQKNPQMNKKNVALVEFTEEESTVSFPLGCRFNAEIWNWMMEVIPACTIEWTSLTCLCLLFYLRGFSVVSSLKVAKLLGLHSVNIRLIPLSSFFFLVLNLSANDSRWSWQRVEIVLPLTTGSALIWKLC